MALHYPIRGDIHQFRILADILLPSLMPHKNRNLCHSPLFIHFLSKHGIKSSRVKGTE